MNCVASEFELVIFCLSFSRFDVRHHIGAGYNVLYPTLHGLRDGVRALERKAGIYSHINVYEVAVS